MDRGAGMVAGGIYVPPPWRRFKSALQGTSAACLPAEIDLCEHKQPASIYGQYALTAIISTGSVVMCRFFRLDNRE